ncbi:MAG: hypothetical protein AB7S70_07760 [Hyphomicrobium sp.]|uniref:hypothetical protein n=1 Tax=Hyphomicrobium sp. TaxID=82 RepID=UPI003D0BB630
MNRITIARSFASVAALLAFGATQPASAGSQASLTMQPLEGVSFDVGSERAVAYFTAHRGSCKLVVTLAAEPDWNNGPSQTYRRFEATVDGGKRTHLRSETDGSAFEFHCEAGAVAMSVTEMQAVASAPAR